MEGDKKHVSAGAASSSSLAAELFGTKESPPSSSAGVFASIFPPPSTVLKKSSNSAGAGTWHKYQHHSGKHGTTAMNGEAGSYGIMGHSRERMEPCHLSSSIYYGGQENYSQSPSSQSPGSYPIVLYITRTLDCFAMPISPSIFQRWHPLTVSFS
ncbi:unnamed protein product [Linum tenue]|uniref:Uncharacterized protein n=1 Tax=Linum tenue TaxID=586396 RepID=A0AAV0Q838_9ROSI|nr:unnamed protein product [Linum tenue]